MADEEDDDEDAGSGEARSASASGMMRTVAERHLQEQKIPDDGSVAHRRRRTSESTLM